MNEYATSTTANYTTATGVSSGYVYIDGGDLPTSNIKINERSRDMMGLYEVAAINTKTNKVFYDRLVAKNSSSAERKLIKKYPEIDEWGEDYLLIRHLWSVEWTTEKPKEVKIVK